MKIIIIITTTTTYENTATLPQSQYSKQKTRNSIRMQLQLTGFNYQLQKQHIYMVTTYTDGSAVHQNRIKMCAFKQKTVV